MMFYKDLSNTVERQYACLYDDMERINEYREIHGSFSQIPEQFYNGYAISRKMLLINQGSDNKTDFTTTGSFGKKKLTPLENQLLSLYIPTFFSEDSDITTKTPGDNRTKFSKMTIDENQRVYASVFYRHVDIDGEIDTIEIRKDVTSIIKEPFNDFMGDLFTILAWFSFISFLWIGWGLRTAYRPLEVALGTTMSRQHDFNVETQVKDPKYGDEVSRVVDRFNDLLNRYSDLAQHNLNTMQDVSHEVKTHLTAIKQSVDMIKLYGPNEPEILKDKLTSIDSSITRATSIMSAILDLARLKQGARKHNMPAYKAGYLLTYFLKFNRNKYIDFDIIMENFTGTAYLEIEREHFFLALNPIMENAIKYSHDSNTILLKAFSNDKDKTVHVSITNTGQPIDPADMPHLFERYYRGVNTGNVNNGSGLGLTITKEVMDIYGGRVKVKSEPTGRTTFTLIFPQAESEDK